jgi:hypothetical protein
LIRRCSSAAGIAIGSAFSVRGSKRLGIMGVIGFVVVLYNLDSVHRGDSSRERISFNFWGFGEIGRRGVGCTDYPRTTGVMFVITACNGKLIQVSFYKNVSSIHQCPDQRNYMNQSER